MKNIIDKSDYDVLCLLPCPVKLPIEMGFYEMIKETGRECDLKYLVEGNANYEVMWMDESSRIPQKEELPEIIVSSGVNSFYRRDFREKAVKEKYFKKIWGMKEMISTEFTDTEGGYHIIALNYLVMVVDLSKLDGRNIPDSFSELLNSNFEKEVAIRGKKSRYCETTLFSIYKEFGLEGIVKLSRLVGYGGHPAEMVKKIGSRIKEAPAISIVPYFYARLLKNNKNAKVIWPKEGAIVSPVTMLVQNDAPQNLDQVQKYFTGEYVRNVCKNAFLPHPLDYLNYLKENNYRLNWIGWDFIRNHDTNKLLIELNKYFL